MGYRMLVSDVQGPVPDGLIAEMEIPWDEMPDDPYYDDISPALYRNFDDEVLDDVFPREDETFYDFCIDDADLEEEEAPREEELELLGEMVDERWRRKDEQEFVQAREYLYYRYCCARCEVRFKLNEQKVRRANKAKTKRIARRHREGRITAHLDDIQVIWDAYEWRQEMMRLRQEDLDRDFW